MKKLAKTIFLITIIMAIYHSYEWMRYEIAFDKYQRCMAMNTNSNIQDIAINYCLQKLK